MSIDRMIHLSDEDLVKEAQKGNMEAVNEVFERFLPMIRSCAKSLYLVGGDEEDLIQEGRLGLYSALADYNEDKNNQFYPFAKLCVNRRMLHLVEASNAKKNAPLNSFVSIYTEDEEERQALEGQISLNNQNPEQRYLDEEQMKRLMDEYKKVLSPLELQVLKELLKGYDYQQIAENMERQPKSIDNAIQRIRIKLKK